MKSALKRKDLFFGDLIRSKFESTNCRIIAISCHDRGPPATLLEVNATRVPIAERCSVLLKSIHTDSAPQQQNHLEANHLTETVASVAGLA